MRKWSILDVRYTILFTYLTHFYKLKFNSILFEKINSMFLDQYNSPTFYQNNCCKFIDSFFKFFKTEIKTLEKLKKNDIFEAVLLESVRRNLFIFFKQLLEITKHENFDLPIKHCNYLLTELLTFRKQWKPVLNTINKSFYFDLNIIEIHARITVVEKIIEETITVLLNKIINFLKPSILEPISRTKLVDIIINKVFVSIEDKKKEVGEISPKLVARYETMLYDVVLDILTKKIASKSEGQVEPIIEKLRDEFTKCISSGESVNIADQIVYMEQLTLFFTSDNPLKCQNALCSIEGLLSFKISKQQMLDLINKKRYQEKNKFGPSLEKMVNAHFTRYKLFNDRQEIRKKTSKKLRTFLNCIIFIVRFKTGKRDKKNRNPSVKKSDRTTSFVFINDTIDFNTIYTKKNVPVKFHIIDKVYMKSKFKGYALTDV